MQLWSLVSKLYSCKLLTKAEVSGEFCQSVLSLVVNPPFLHLDFYFKNLQNTSKTACIDTGLQISQSFEKHWESSSGHTLSYCPNWVKFLLELECGDLVYKLRRVKGAVNFVPSGPKIVKCLRCRKFDPVII